jgi:glycosyltransferase involved in cell wall biosynthesis
MVDGAWEIAHRKGWCGDDDIVTFQGQSYGWRVRLTRALQRWWWGRAARIVCCSEFLRGILVEHHGVDPDKAVTIVNAYHGPRASDVRETPSEARARLGLSLERRYVLTICRLMGWKRVDNIIRALASWPADVELLVAGDGDKLAEWTRLAAELGLAERVRFLGNVPHADIPRWIRAADLFVLNSEYEGLSHTLLEAQALGTPIIASGVCGNPEVIEHDANGLLVDPRDPADLASAGRRILDDPALGARFAREGLARAPRFDRDARFAEVAGVLASVSR